eukprot:TRINITY_DN67133_c7_g3_i1.p2 TRINITY_DN67133_c7_g3~~TRINITY_DN67133_c7_g3_i1.p2  ORF type:complete len:170 (-),score=53.24 TRINITY_DN67133_c7_g3_i1:194-676(-)
MTTTTTTTTTTVLVTLAAALAIVAGHVTALDPTVTEIDKERCVQVGNGPPPPNVNITIRESCNLCDLIVKNSMRWTHWKTASEIGSLCLGSPPHLRDMCEYYVCRMLQCPDFKDSACATTDQFGVVTKMEPCQARFICWNCLNVPEEHVRGCFDDLIPSH